MGLIKAVTGAAGGVMADQWKEYFYCEAMPANILATKGHKKVTGRSSNYKGDENIITNGSMIAVADGQCMLIVEQGKVVEVCAEPGEYTYDASTEPTIFAGNLGESIGQVFQNIGKRFTFGGEAPKDQRIYYFNTKELTGNKYGTPSPVPFRVVDQRAGIDIDIGIRCFGEYSIRLKNPLLFYTNVCGNVSEEYKTENIEGQMKTELLTALQPAFAKISEMGIRYSVIKCREGYRFVTILGRTVHKHGRSVQLKIIISAHMNLILVICHCKRSAFQRSRSPENVEISGKPYQKEIKTPLYFSFLHQKAPRLPHCTREPGRFLARYGLSYFRAIISV